jgi:hypothetical protein
MVHYRDTIQAKVAPGRIASLVSQDLRAALLRTFGQSPIAVWGSEAGPKNRAKYDRMQPGDDVLIIEGRSVKLLAKVAAKTENKALSRELWKPLRQGGETTWELIYFLANPRELNLPFAEVCRLFGYDETLQLRGFTAIAPERIQRFYNLYDDLYSVLVRLEQGQPIARLSDVPEPVAAASQLEIVNDVLSDKTISDHTRMQWTLARLGLKAGEKVWVPVGDQSRLRQAYDFRESTYRTPTSRISMSSGSRNSGSAPPTKSRTRLRSIPACFASRT